MQTVTARPPAPQPRSLRGPKMTTRWLVWVVAAAAAAVASMALELLQHSSMMSLPMATYHGLSALLHGALLAIPVLLFIRWRETARGEREANRLLRASEALREEMTGMLVHDLKSPLAASIGSLQTVLESDSEQRLEPLDQELLTIAYESQTRLAGMIGDILDIARAEAGEMPLVKSQTDLAQLVNEALSEARAGAGDRGLEIEADLEDMPLALVDPEKVRRVLDNLLANAVKYTPAGGSVTVRLTRSNGDAVITVRDTGAGIPEHLHKQIFDKFGQAEVAREIGKVSVGLGLAFCKLAVEAHGGTIRVESAPGKGSAFIFTLPGAKDR